MATQHPDNALPPYWDERQRPFISVYQEIKEAVTCFKDLGVGEYMWDWEGKHADAAVIDRLFSDHHDYFAKHQLGRDKFLTFRIPNIWEEKGYNLLQAMTVILSSEDFARDLKLNGRPLFEVILPMTERADQLMHIHRLFEKLAYFKSNEFTTDVTNTDYLELIPLIESVESQLAIDDLLNDYVKFHKQHFGQPPEYVRTFLACSDSALSSGFLAGIIGNKIGLARVYEFSAQTGIPVFPIFGSGSLLFRGGLAPNTVDRFMQEFPGVRTVSIQSSFRYDYPKTTVKKAIIKLEKELPKAKPLKIASKDQQQLIAIAEKSAKLYKETFGKIIANMQPVFNNVPKRRDRRQHIGLLAYARSMGGQTMPRAITFTAGFYSIGLPPEFIGLGRTLKNIDKKDLQLLKDHYPNLTTDLEAAGRFINRENLKKFAKGSSDWKDIKADVELTEKILGITFGPQTKDEIAHQRLSTLLTQTEDAAKGSKLINEMAILRKSLG
ncbi:phosphoenolpyruvate carboxylase [Candidatus Saccharibacteria bacterium CG_4_10_14_0_2_um_filter_52_9]|nr:MAG: phosphoenolpyruvate carboxylase [Candidatus Saccharibacteria bacterium CG_4_10_14_0_2_um_filter_52_9]